MDVEELRMRLIDAADNGELLTCIYEAGSCPGTKRRILPRRVMGDRIYATTDQSPKIKTYLLESLRIVHDDDPAPWIQDVPTTRDRAIRADPTSYFEAWIYAIRPSLYPALGMLKREYVCKSLTASARKSAANRGASKDEVARIKVVELDFGVMPCPVFDFHDGDTFYSATAPTLQVVSVQAYIEIHLLIDGPKPRRAYLLVDTDLAHWLQFGIPSDVEQFRISPWETNSPALFDAIEPTSVEPS